MTIYVDHGNWSSIATKNHEDTDDRHRTEKRKMKTILNQDQYNIVSTPKEINLNNKLIKKKICAKILPVAMFHLGEI